MKRPTVEEMAWVIQSQTQALKDIINAADNGEPYSPRELSTIFDEDYSLGYAMLERLGVEEIA